MSQTLLRRQGGTARLATGLLAVLLAAALLPLAAAPVQASEAPGADGAGDEVRPLQRKIEINHQQDSVAMWTWSRGRRAYVLRSGSLFTGMQTIVAFDTSTGAEVGKAPLAVPGYTRPGGSHSGPDRAMAVDEEGGRLFVATQSTLGSLAFVDVAATVTGEANEVVTGQACLRAPELACVNGVSVLDAESLEHVRHIPLQPLRVDGGAAGAELLAMEYAPPTDLLPAKVYLLVQEMAYYAENGVIDGAFTRQNPRQFGPALTYLVQMDPATGRQDWVVSLDACKGNRYASDSTQYMTTASLPYRAAVFRGQRPGELAVYAACHTNTQPLTAGVARVALDAEGYPVTTGGVPPLDPPTLEPPEPESGTPEQRLVDAMPERQQSVEGPDQVYNMIADPESGRFLLQVLDGKPMAQVWWVFDTTVMQFIGTIGIGGPVEYDSTMAGLSRRTGRLYVFAGAERKAGLSFGGGLFVTDVRTTPVAQALHFPDWAGVYPANAGQDSDRFPLVIEEPPEGGTRVWYIDSIEQFWRRAWLAFEDHRPPLAPAPPPEDYEGRTFDLEELPGVTASTMDGAARGYGFRALLVGGPEAALRLGPFDPVGNVDQCNDRDWGYALNTLGAGFINLVTRSGRNTGGPCYVLGVPLNNPCVKGDREIIFASVGREVPAVVDDQGARGAAEPLTLDVLTQSHLERPATRCSSQDWEVLWSTALFGRPPVPEPAAPAGSDPLVARCVSSSAEPSATVGDPVSNGYSATVECAETEANGHAYTRGGSVAGVGVAEALSSFRIYRDPGRGIVSRVESATRGVTIDGVASIEMVRGVAESWANGRRQPLVAAEREPGYDPNCDLERSAGTCFQRHLFGLRMPGYSCGPCGDEQAFIQAMNGAFNPYTTFRLREPDTRLSQGSENGFIAAIQKPTHERFGDMVLNNDLLQTVLPTLEVIRFAPPNRPISREGTRGRQIYQFAGVEVSSSYSVQCLLVYDEATGVCAPPVEEAGSVTVVLHDTGGRPLAGGAFEVRADADGDGVLGLADELVGEGACVTGEDGTGTCRFENLAPGSYLVSQVAAPPGYAAVEEPWVSEVAPGEARTVTFTNASNLSTIEVSAVDDAGKPLSGATFAVFADPDADGKVAPDTQPVASCTTGADGTCSMQVPAGSYVLVQTAAPAGLAPIEPVAFALTSGGQVAAVGVVNSAASVAAPEAPPAAAPPVVYQPPRAAAPPVERVTPVDPAPEAAPEAAPEVGPARDLGGTVTRVVRAPADALRLLTRSPVEAAAWTATLALLCLAAMAVTRRRAAMRLR